MSEFLRDYLEAAIHDIRCGRDDEALLNMWRAMKELDKSESYSNTSDGPPVYHRVVYDRISDFEHTSQFDWTRREVYGEPNE